MGGFYFSSLLGGMNYFSGERLNLNIDNDAKESSFLSRAGKPRG
tara:strand:- start:26439 stop:26570 length:132 start_codon:yes stop_codon:yes gene_type:complete